MPRAPAKCGDPVDQRQRPLLIGLHGKAKPIPAGKPRVGQHGGEHVEADLQPVGLLRIDGQADIRRLRRQASAASVPISAGTQRAACNGS